MLQASVLFNCAVLMKKKIGHNQFHIDKKNSEIYHNEYFLNP